MRWLAFRRMRVGARVVWGPSCERGVVVRRIEGGDEVWVRWASGREEKLVAAEDAYHLHQDESTQRSIVTPQDLELRKMRETDESPEERARVWEMAKAIRAERRSNIDPRPSSVPLPRRARTAARRTG